MEFSRLAYRGGAHSDPRHGGSTLAPLVFAVLALATFVRLRPDRRRVLAVSAIFIAAWVSRELLAADSAALTRAWRVADAVLTLVVGVCVIQVASILLVRLVLPALRYSPPRILREVVVVVAVVGWGLVVLHEQGVDPTSIVTTSAVLTAIIGLSLQDTLGNVLGGLALQSDRSVKVGDWIQVDGTSGQVVEITWRHTSIETNNWETMVIPNSHLVKNRLVVLGRYSNRPVQHRRWLPFFVDAAVEPQDVVAAVEDSLRRLDLPGMAKEPPPECLLVELAENPVRYAVSYWLTNLASPNPTDSSVRVQTYLALTRGGIPVAVPARVLHVHEETDDESAARHREETERRVAALRTVDLFADLEQETLEWLAARLTDAPYLVGDTLVRQGAPSKRLYIVVRGAAEVFVESPESGRVKVSDLGPGTFFGEMGMMTGEPRTATVVATTDMRTYRLDKGSFGELLALRPELADHIAEVLGTRRVELDGARESLDAEDARRRAATKSSAIRDALRTLFGLESTRSAEVSSDARS